jgi:RND superfamily putative drug exporter
VEPPPEHSLRGRAAATLAATLAAVVAFGLVGLDVEDHLRPTSLLISGTPSADGEALSRAHFGQSAPFALLLRGPAAAVERQGTRLTAGLRRDRDLTVISPWDGTRASKKLPHPPAGTPPGAPSRALLLVDSHVSPATAIDDTVPALDRTIDARVHPPVVAVQSGYATISRALQSESLAASERAELLAAPLLIIVLLLVFRSVVAAAIPLLFGAMTVFAARGVLALLSSLMSIDALSLVVCTMMGLALGVDYSLLIVSRFREELEKDGSAAAAAAAATRRSAGRTTAVAGSTLFVSIFLSAFLQAGTLLVSLATALVVVTGIAVLIAWLALPALLTLLGARVNAWPIGRSRPGGRSAVAAAAGRALRRPRLAALAVALPLALLAIPALAFNTGSPGVDELPAGSGARDDAETIAELAGPGWEAPFLLTVAARRGPITGWRRLRFLAQTQRRVERLPGVEAVIGPAVIAASAGPLRPLAAQLERNSSAPQLTRLRPRLRRASGAVSELRGGLAEAAAAGGLLSEGSARAGGGAEALADGLDQAGAGGERAASALARLASGSRRLVAGQREASASAYGLSVGLNTLEPNLTAQGLKRARKLAARLRSASSEDPGLRAAAHEAAVLASVLAVSREEIQRLSGQATALRRGLTRLHNGGRRLHAGSDRLSTAARRLDGGLDALGGGAQRLSAGLGRLHDGAGRLSVELARGFHRGYRLERALREGEKPLTAAAALSRRLESLHRTSPALFKSGFLPLAAIDGAGSVRRSLAAEVLAVARGGTAARYLIVPAAGFNTPGSRHLGSRLHSVAAEIDRTDAFGAGVSGGAAVLNDYGDATKARLPLVIGAIIAITFLMLLALLRAPLLAALTVALNLLTVAAAIGVVTLACKIPAGYPLGGHPYIDTVGGAAIFGVTFGLSIDYAVFLLARMREHYREHGDNAAAISFGLDRTAGVITGAAAIMAAVFASFALAPVATVSQMGLGLTVAILLDATIVRIVLLPALMLLIGKRVWRTPPWLQRLSRPAPQAPAAAAATEAG